jgi:O-antigen ligase
MSDGRGARGGATMIGPIVALLAAVALGAAAGVARLDGRPVVAPAAAVLVAALVIAAAAIVGRAAGRPFLVPLPAGLALIAAGAALGLAAADDPRPRATLAFLAIALVALAACQLAAALPPRAVLAAAGGLLFLVSQLALVGAASGGVGVTLAQDGSARLGWPFQHPNFLGAALALLLAPALAGAVAARSWAGRLALGASVLVGLVALALTQSRSAWIGALTALVVLAVYGVGRRVIAIGLPLAAAASLPLTIPRLNSPDLGLENPRGDIWADAWRLFLERPLTGIGIDNVALLAAPQDAVRGTPTSFHAHSLYLNALVETGVLGFAGVLLLVGGALLAAHRAAAGASGARRALGAGLAAAIVALAAAGVLDSTLDDPLSAAIAWAVLGAAVGACAARAPAGVRPLRAGGAARGASGAG